MEYCYSGTKSLWCGSWNRNACHQGKCAADRPSQSTGVNPSRRQRCCSPSCLWSQAQRNNPDNSHNLGYWLTIRHRCICMWRWTEMLTFSFQLRAKTMNSASYEYRNMSARGTLAHWNADYLLKIRLIWCIHLSRSLFLYFNYLVGVTAGGPVSPRRHMEPSSTVDFGWFVIFWEHQIIRVKLIEIVILWVYYTIPLASACFGTFGISLSNFWNCCVWLRITDEGSVIEMRIWPILWIKSD